MTLGPSLRASPSMRLVCASAVAVLAGCGREDPGAGQAADDASVPNGTSPGGDAEVDVLIAAVGDLNLDGVVGPQTDPGRTAASIRALGPSYVLGLGDFQYPEGTLAALESGFGANFGDLVGITMPTAGPLHDVASSTDQLGYQSYWHRDGFAPYSFDAGSWHIVSLPSAALAYGVDVDAIRAWLEEDLSASDQPCTLAFWHEPYWSRSTTTHPSPADGVMTSAERPWLEALYAHGAELILNGHQHDYQRFAAMRPDGTADPEGVREIIVGTGGINHYAFEGDAPNVDASDDGTFGVLALTLREDGYEWRFIPNPPGVFSDAGSGACH